MTLFGGIEAGGTKFICAVGSSPEDIRAQTQFPTTSPADTLPKVFAFFQQQVANHGKLAALGIAAFGPVDLNPASPTWGYVTTTPKPGWANFNFASTMQHQLGLPVGFDTDVNGAALGEWRWGAAKGLDTFIYLTIGTGIGGGAMVGGRLVHGMVHPEMGHILVPHDRERDPFPGSCPSHGDCLEGLANGPAIMKRWGVPGSELPPDHPAWELEAHYLAIALMDYILVLSPQRVILGGGVMNQPQLFPLVRREVQALLNGYVNAPQILEQVDGYIVPPALGGRAGIAGALALAELALSKPPKAI